MSEPNDIVNQIGNQGVARSPLYHPIKQLHIFETTSSKLGQLATSSGSKLNNFLTWNMPLQDFHWSSSSSAADKKLREDILSDARRYLETLKATSGHILTPALKRARKATRRSEISQSSTPSSKIDYDPPLPKTDEPLSNEALENLKQVITRSNEVLASATTVFPLTLFRDDIVVDRTKVTITKRNFFFSREIMSIRIEDILNVKVIIGPFFGSIVLAVRILSSEDHHSINYFWRKDATRLKHIIQGYIIAQHNNIDCTHQSKEELITTLTELGHDTSR